MSSNLKVRVVGSLAAVVTALALPLVSVVPAIAAPLADVGGVSAPSDVAVGDLVALTIYLPVNNQAGAEAAARAIQTPGNPGYHHFLSVPQFVRSYGASDNEIANVAAILQGLGFTINYVYPNHLAVEAVSTAAAAQSAFGLTLKHFSLNGRSGIVSTTVPKIPAALVGRIRGVAGFDTLTHPRPNYLAAITGRGSARPVPAQNLVGGTPGNYLPADFAKYYNVSPIYRAGITGHGSTIGIVTLNTFKPADAYTFWKKIGLNVSQSRITKVNVDGGETAKTNNLGGEGETDLDVEESGALAPDAKIRVYIAPNISNANFVNGFEAAASENIADTVSASWGQPELDFFYNLATKTTGDSFLLDAFHDAFLEMALQGQSVFVASGDSGSFDTVRGCPAYGTPTAMAPTCNAPYAVDHPASDPLVTAAGGTTTPYSFSLNDGAVLSVKHEQAWGWDYISNEDPKIPASALFAVGDGGGVSSYWAQPWYQFGTPGITRTKPGQTLTQNNGAGSVLQYRLPANFAGRNLPDISTDADPESGFQFIEEGQIINFTGGTSFVAPQLNGVNALFVQALGKRVGQINTAYYQLGSRASTDITFGDNWGYAAASGYENAAGSGALSATKLLVGLFSLEYGASSPAAVRARTLFPVK